jgi:hypothetical protein
MNTIKLNKFAGGKKGLQGSVSGEADGGCFQWLSRLLIIFYGFIAV